MPIVSSLSRSRQIVASVSSIGVRGEAGPASADTVAPARSDTASASGASSSTADRGAIFSDGAVSEAGPS